MRKLLSGRKSKGDEREKPVEVYAATNRRPSRDSEGLFAMAQTDTKHPEASGIPLVSGEFATVDPQTLAKQTIQEPPQAAEVLLATVYSPPQASAEQQPELGTEYPGMTRGPLEVAEEPSVTVHPPPHPNAGQQPQTDRALCPAIEGALEVTNDPATVDPPPQTYTEYPETTPGPKVSEESFVMVNTEDLEPDDIVIAVMGPTGSGKSTFIRLASGRDIQGIGHELTSFTKEVLAIRFRDQESGRHVVLVDTPAFDDTFKSDLDILNTISNWLNSSYKRGKLLSGILYLHRITDNRMAGTPLRNLRVFRKLCGKDALDKVYLTTTMWDEVDQSIGERRLEELGTEYWRSMIIQGAEVVCLQNNEDSAKQIIQQILSQEVVRKAVLLQEEMADLRKELEETQAGQELYSQLEKLVERQMVLLKRIDEERKVASKEGVLDELQGEYNGLRVQIDGKLRQMQELKLSWLKYLLRFLSRKYLATVHLPPQTCTGLRFQTDAEPPETARGPHVSEEPTTISTEDLEPDDIVIAIMGLTGSGKSTFVRLASGHDDVQGIGHGLISCTKDVRAIRFVDQESGRRVVLVDTPGFNDTFKSDIDILDMISDWLNSSYKRRKLLSGIVYLHRITDNRMAGTLLRNLRLLEKLCGNDALRKVYLTTTMWDEVDKSIGERRLEELKTEYWKSMLAQGAQAVRSHTDKESARRIIQQIVSQHASHKPMLLQREMADLRKELKESESRKELYYQLERLIERQTVLLQKIDRERKEASDASVLELLRREYKDLGVQIDDKLRRIQELRLSWLESLLRFISRKAG
ncbi:P-loop containing nucleoside triphosphate hydrolase protein [Boletus reticuloceps]|uniref:P-loop containing nucleoside triphosphate hydrolase protein n=1 Tax=Boletus reticuloceps TaxID=495285 RepID=A0A8I2YYY0_9AGAM|nr:P-loop containing nucleoside triphosphate hydrolase protein [Boletus reticuloceps]